MEIFYSLAVGRAIFVLGILNLVAALLVFFSCRCLGSANLGKKLMKYRPYQRFYKYHCYVWWVFWPSVTVHAFLAIMRLGWPG